MMENLTHGSLFSGIGGFEEGAKLAGIKNIWNCEYENYQKKILQQKYKNSTQFGDITKENITEYVDIISGGFPCQDISVAGQGIGINGPRSGLWSEMFRIIRNIRPKYIIIENSPALLIRGFEKVLCDLSEIGYDAEWQVLSNNQFGFPHIRKRVYVIAYSHKIGQQRYISNKRDFTSIFKKWSSNSHSGYISAQRIYALANSADFRAGDGIRHWTHRVGSIGNSVNPIVAAYLFNCIKNFNA